MTCGVPDCTRRGKARGLCAMHYLRWQRTGDPMTVRPRPSGDAHPRPTAGRTGELSAAWRGIDVTYVGAHARVSRTRGKASEHWCDSCDSRARGWAYDHTDPDPLSEVTPRGRTVFYSPDPERYFPACNPCHTAFDRARLRREQVA